ncbi:MAG: hypothetical protein ACAI38_17860 [Myxococcota bacterium]|nr:hypothetical protein [Myxococcota bacterium]
MSTPVSAFADASAIAGITVFPGKLYPPFAPEIEAYDVDLPLGAAGFSLSIAPKSPDARVHIDGVAVRLTTVPRGTTTRVEVTDESGATTLVTMRSRPPKQTAYVKASNPDVGDGFGVALAISADGSALAVGAPGEDGKSLGAGGKQTDNKRVDSGAVYVYSRAGESWRFDGYVKSRLPAHGFGAAVALSSDGKLLAVGEPDEDSGATGSGAVEIFERQRRGWRHVTLVKPREPTRGGGFGASVALSWDTLVVGAPGEDAAYLVSRKRAWRTVERVAGAPAGERFGEAVSLGADGTTLAVSGEVTTRVYTQTKAGMREVLTLPGQRGVVSGSGHVVAAIEPARDCVHVYRNGEHGWFAAAQFPGAGERLALDFAGNALVIGNAVDRFNYRGGARVFRWDGKAWLPGEPLIAANASANDLGGVAVTIDARGETVVVGAPGEDGAGAELSGDPGTDSIESSGAAYVFR